MLFVGLLAQHSVQKHLETTSSNKLAVGCPLLCLYHCSIGKFGEEIEWEKLLALSCTALEKVCSHCFNP